MGEKPIIFSGESVRAILEGRKTQTRRVVRLREFRTCDNVPGSDWYFRAKKTGIWSDVSTRRLIEKYCPYGQPGDRLWVRETWRDHKSRPKDEKGAVYYDSDLLKTLTEDKSRWLHEWYKKRPSIFMPRWASRITLEITGVRVERVRDISSDDVTAEGIENCPRCHGWLYYESGGDTYDCDCTDDFTLKQYENLWNFINAKRGYSWESNPWVWVIEFKKVEDNNG